MAGIMDGLMDNLIYNRKEMEALVTTGSIFTNLRSKFET